MHRPSKSSKKSVGLPAWRDATPDGRKANTRNTSLESSVSTVGTKNSNGIRRKKDGGTRKTIQASRTPGRLGFGKSFTAESSYAPDSILRLPRKVRVIIWNLLDFPYLLNLRLTCKTIKQDIDSYVGLKVELDGVHQSFPYLIKLGIQCAIILDILAIQGGFLRHPELLKDLQVFGGVASRTFAKMMLECQNITHLTIQFNKDLCASKPQLFPVDIPKNRKLLPRLKFLRIEANMKADVDVRYVRNNFVGLIQNHLLHQVHPNVIQVIITHRTASEVISECSHIMSVFVCDNCRSLRELHSDIKLLVTASIVDEFLRRKESGNEVRFSDLIRNEICTETKNPDWDAFDKLEVLHFSSSSKDFSCFWQKMLPKVNKLVSLCCDIHSPISWNYYKQFLEGNESTLKEVRFLSAQNFGPSCTAEALDLRIFRKCKKLEVLVIGQSKGSDGGSKLENISKLPSGLKDAEFCWLVLDWYDAIQIARFPHMRRLKLAYFSASSVSFGRFMLFLRWAYTCGCSRLNEFIIVDFKIRYQQNKSKLDAILKNKSLEATYIDYDETRLELRR